MRALPSVKSSTVYGTELLFVIRRSAYDTATDCMAARLFGNRSIQPRLQTVDGDIAWPSEKFASLICVCFIGVSLHGHQSYGRCGSNPDLSQKGAEEFFQLLGAFQRAVTNGH